MEWRLWLGATALLAGLAACGSDETPQPVDPSPVCQEGDTLCGLSCVDIENDPRNCGACDAACGNGEVCVEGQCLIGCPGEQTACDGSCYDLGTSRENCGACGTVCGDGEICSDGACTGVCPTGQELCDGTCQALSTSAEHCGACGNVCATGEVCAEGSCVQECPGAQAACDGGCFDLESSRENCGACGTACGAGEVCVDGACATSCAAGFTDCDGTCRELDTDRANCGACGNACGNDELCVDGACQLVCATGLSQCDESCRDTNADRNNCGACGNACGADEACVDGTCTLTCGALAPDVCDASCTNVQNDPQNCGACGNGCAAGEVCSAGACAETCGDGLDVCGGSCTSLDDDPNNCGTCGNVCAGGSNGTAVCSAGVCASVCAPGYGNCDGDAFGANGCEALLATDIDHCGVCGNGCGQPANATGACTAGTCGIAQCDAGFTDCDGDVATGCEAELDSDPANCGGCGIACTGDQFCSSGTCLDPGPGEDCTVPYPITSGSNLISWTAQQNNYYDFTPSCMSVGTPDGPDIVLQYDATFNGEVQLYFPNKPTSTRWVAMVSDAPCGTVAPELACISDWSPNFMEGTFNVTAGTTYYIYVVDSTSGTAPLNHPLDVDVNEFNCANYPPVTVTWNSPADGSTTGSLAPQLDVTFSDAIADEGTVMLTGNLGTTQSYTLPSSAVSVSGSTMTITPDAPFQAGEQVTVSWTGVVGARCRDAITAPTWSFTVPTPPCSPGSNGMVGATMSRIGMDNLWGTVSEFYVAADASPTGYVYVGGTSTLYRTPKLGGLSEEVHTAAGIGSTELGYAMHIDGLNIYTADSKTSGSDGHIYRISSDGGVTWSVQDVASFGTSAPADDFRSLASHGNRLYFMTQEGTGSVNTQIWSIDQTAATMPDLAVLELEFGANAYTYCGGLAVDASYYYANCRQGTSGSNYAVLAIDRQFGTITEIATGLPGNTTAMAIVAADANADGTTDYLYLKGSDEQGAFVCNPHGTPYVDVHYNFGPGSGNYGLGFDSTGNVLWAFDDDTQEYVRIQ